MNLKKIAKQLASLAAALLLCLTLTGCESLLSLLPLDLLLPPVDTDVSDAPSDTPSAEDPITLETVPDWSGEAFVELEFNVPAFTEEDLTRASFESYAALDVLGRCGEAFALVGPETVPTEEREPIGMIRPSGWQTVRYDDLVDGKYLYNRCHLIGYQLTGENANECNLITGTRYLNIEGMLPFENAVANYVEETGNHVLYRVTPIFEGVELVARAVVMEAYSVEDNGEGICFHVYAYNAQPGVAIDYLTGLSRRTDSGAAEEQTPLPAPVSDEEPPEDSAPPAGEDTQSTATDSGAQADVTYVFNKKSMRFHTPACDGAKTMSEKNKELFSGTREEAIALGYAPCGTCKP